MCSHISTYPLTDFWLAKHHAPFLYHLTTMGSPVSLTTGIQICFGNFKNIDGIGCKINMDRLML